MQILIFIVLKTKGRSLQSHEHLYEYGSRTIAAKENCPPTPKTNPKPSLTLTGGDFSRGQLSDCPPTLKLTLTLTQTPTVTGGGSFPQEAIVRIPWPGEGGNFRRGAIVQIPMNMHSVNIENMHPILGTISLYNKSYFYRIESLFTEKWSIFLFRSTWNFINRGLCHGCFIDNIPKFSE